MADPDDVHYVTTEDEMRALAHPLRLRLLAMLRSDGPSTASALGERIGESSGVTSYHLRYLAERDFVTEDPTLGNKRERWWKAAQQMTEWDTADFLETRSGRAAELAFRREALRFHRAAVDNWTVEQSTWPPEWVSAAITSDVMFRLSLDEFRSFADDYRALLEKYDGYGRANEERSDDEAAGDTERVYVIMHAFPSRGLTP